MSLLVVMASLMVSCSEEPVYEINGHEYVDLGLPSGLKWATCNVRSEGWPRQVLRAGSDSYSFLFFWQSLTFLTVLTLLTLLTGGLKLLKLLKRVKVCRSV